MDSLKKTAVATLGSILLFVTGNLRAQGPYGSSETLVFDGKATPLGVFQVSDPGLFNLGGQWLAFLATVGWKADCSAPANYVPTIRFAVGALPPSQTLGSAPSNWQIIPDGKGSYAQFILPGAAGSFDQDAVESPQPVIGYDPTQGKNVVRVYYTGWRRVQTASDSNGCPVYGYQDWEIGMAEWSATSNQWVKRTASVLAAANSWEQMHYVQPDGTRVAYSMVGDQSVVYVPAAGAQPAAWHLYYQVVTDIPTVRVITVHAVSTDGVSWPAANRSILQTHPPSPSTALPGGPYSISVTMIGGKFYFVGWVPNADVNKQGLWLVSSTTPDGSASGDFTNWLPLLFDGNGTWWHTGNAQSLASHQTGVAAPILIQENGLLWLYYSGVREDADGYWTSVGRASVDPAVLH